MKALILALGWISAFSLPGLALAAPRCAQSDDYGRALCLYRGHEYAGAARLFESIVEKNEQRPETIKSLYFLARSRMMLQQYAEAKLHLTDIYSRSRVFYQEWGCDFLLGENRRALGQS